MGWEEKKVNTGSTQAWCYQVKVMGTHPVLSIISVHGHKEKKKKKGMIVGFQSREGEFLRGQALVEG